MSERGDLWKLLDAIQMDARALNAKIVELRSLAAALKIDHVERPRAGSPRELPPGVCPYCHVGKAHTADCPTIRGFYDPSLYADTPTDDPDPATEGTGMKPAHPPENPSNRTTRG